MASRKLFLCFETSDEQEINIAQRYWALNEEGKWIESVDSVAQAYRIAKHQLPSRVQAAVSAHDLESRCFWCKLPEPLKSRTSLTSIYSRSSGFRRYPEPQGAQLCPSCEAKYQQIQKEAAQAKERERLQKVTQALVNVAQCQVRLSLDGISVIDAAYLLALLLSSETQVIENKYEVFNLSGVLSGSERVDGEVCQRLFEIGAITPSVTSSLGAIAINDKGKISIAWPKAHFELGPGIKDIPSRTLCDRLSTLLDGAKATRAETEGMWQHVAFAECETVLLAQIRYYRLGDYLVGEKTIQSFQYALERFSIPQVWGIIYSVAKNSASLRQSQTYTAVHIRNMIPKMIISFVDRAVDNNWNVYPRTRKEYHLEGVLTSLFFSRVLRQSSDAFRLTTTNSIRQI